MAGILVSKIVKKENIMQTPISAILCVIVSFEIISVLWAPDATIAVWSSILIILNLLLFYATTNIVVNKSILRRSIKVWILAGVIASTAIILSQWIDILRVIYITTHSGFKFAFQEQVTRPAGLAGVDHVAGFVSTAIFMTLGSMVWESRWKVKAMYFIFILYMLYSIIITGSRGVLIGLSGAYIFFILMHNHFMGRFIRHTFVFMCIIFFLTLTAKPGLIDRMLIGFGYTGTLYFSQTESYHGTEAKTEHGEGLSGMEMRKIWWENSLKEMVRHPTKLLFGLGIGGFFLYSQGDNTTVSSPEVSSVSLAFFYDLGLLGIILFVFLAYLIVSNLHYYLRKSEKDYSYYMLLASTAALVAETVIHGFIDFDLTSYGSKYFWFPLGFNMAVLNIVKNELNEYKTYK